MTGSIGSSVGLGDGNDYRNLVYVLPTDGSCASQGCAEAVITLPTMFNLCGSCSGEVRYITVTSLAAGYIGPTPYLAVGLSDGGVQIYNVNDPEIAAAHRDLPGGGPGVDDSQTPQTALAWDPSGSGLLAVGVISWADEGFFVPINSNGRGPGGWLAGVVAGGRSFVGDGRVVGGVRAAPGRHPGGGVRAERRDGAGWSIRQPAARRTAQLGAIKPGEWPHRDQSDPRFDGSSGGPDFAVSHQTTPGPDMAGDGGLLRWDGTSANLTVLPVTRVRRTR
jgi:hypothetical protein